MGLTGVSQRFHGAFTFFAGFTEFIGFTSFTSFTGFTGLVASLVGVYWLH